MSVSTDGILCYGICLPESDKLRWLKKKAVEPEKPEEVDENGDYEGDDRELMDFEDFIAELGGLKKPNTDFKKDKNGWEKYWDSKEKLVKKTGVDLVSHCSGDYPMHILAIKESVTRSNRGYPEKLGKEIKGKPEEWDVRLKASCERVGIKYENPQWILCSYWS